jgi:predicted restriction endonuclease
VGLPLADIAKNTEVTRCQNLHRTFDHSLVGIDQDYCILISKPTRKLGEHNYSLQELEGTKFCHQII